jgi:hypothetical protein
MKQTKVRIVWNGKGGELDSVVVAYSERAANADEVLTNALVKLVSGNIVTPGDSFIVEEVA